MSNRFHNKFHRHNHHSLSSVDPDYPDAGFDPIASYSSPFKGEFFSTGDIVTIADISGKNAGFTGNVEITGNLNVLGGYSYLETQVTISSATQITNTGTLTALTVIQQGEYPVAHFFDDGNTAFFVSGSSASPGYVGIGTHTPNKKLTVMGDISASGSISIGTLSSSLTSNEVIVNEDGTLKVKSASSILTNNLNFNYVPKVSSSGSGLVDSIIYDDGIGNIGINTQTPGATLTIEGDLSASGNIFFSNLLSSVTATNVVVQENGKLKIKEFSAFASSGGVSFTNLNSNFVPKISSSGTDFENSSIYVDSLGNVGIKTTNPTAQLTVSGNISASQNLLVSGDINTDSKYLSSGVDVLDIIKNLLTFTSDLTVNLRPGKSFGKYKNLDVIPSAGKTVKEVIELATWEHVEAVVSTFTIEKNPTSLLNYETDFYREKGNVFSKITVVIDKANFPLSLWAIQRLDSVSGVWSTLSSDSIVGDPNSLTFSYIDNDPTVKSADFVTYRIQVKDNYQIAHSMQTYSIPKTINFYSSFYVGTDTSVHTMAGLSSFLVPIALGNTNIISLTGITNGLSDCTYIIAPASKGNITSATFNGINLLSNLVPQIGTFVGTNVYGVSANYTSTQATAFAVSTDLYTLTW